MPFHHNILLIGVTCYIGGTLLARVKAAQLPAYENLFVYFQSEKQLQELGVAESVAQYGAKPVYIDLRDGAAVLKAFVEHKITILVQIAVFKGIELDVQFIKALAGVKEVTRSDVHYLRVS